MPKVSVAMCTYNGELYLREQLNSIAAQTLRPFELIICDDGSTDGTPAILAEFASTAELDVKIFRNVVKLGAAKNFEQAIQRCNGELIALADQDDVWRATKLERLANRLGEDPPLGAVFCDADLMDEHSNPTGESLWQVFGIGAREQAIIARGDAFRLLCVRDFVTGAAMMFRAALRTHLLPIDAYWMHDGWITWMVVLHSRLGFVPERLMSYRVHSAQQIGVPPRGWRNRLARLRTSEAAACSGKARRFQALAAHCAEHGVCGTEVLAALRQVAELYCMRADLPAGVLSRGGRVLSRIPSYLSYTSGWRTVIRDILQNRGASGIPGASG